jgi:gluconolactonase
MTLAKETVASGLRFPEGPVAMPDGSVLVVEIERGTLSRISADGTVDVVAACGGGPNGAAVGPDGKVYVTNNGGFAWVDGMPTVAAEDYVGGSIERVTSSAARSKRSARAAETTR